MDYLTVLIMLLKQQKILKNSNIVFLFIGDGAKKNELVKNSQKNNLKNIIFLEKKKRESLQIIGVFVVQD